MCGILGITGDNVTNIDIVTRLQRLEYRGYDSFGYGSANTTDQGDQFDVTRQVGKVSDYLKQSHESDTLGTAVSHTRWATHGIVNIPNTHPHLSYDNSICLVHNGVIENYQQIKKMLLDKGIEFKSDTDTEVVVNLLAHTYNQTVNLEPTDRMQGLATCLRLLKGTYAITYITQDEPDTIYYAKKGSPLVLGHGETRRYVSSDIYTFIDETDKVMYLSDGDYGYITARELVKNNLDSTIYSDVEWTRVTASYDQVELGNYQHYMIKEICEQKDVIKNTVRSQPEESVQAAIDMIQNSRRIIFSACGSSFYSSMVGANLLRDQNILCECVLSSEFPSHTNTLQSNDLIVCVSQSGETADIIESINLAKGKGCKILSIVNVANSTIDRLSDYTVYVNAGPELCVLSTKSFTSQVALFMLLWSRLSNQTIGFEALESNMYELVATSTRTAIRDIANVLYHKDHIYCLGRGEQYPVAMEAALKIKEVSYIHAEGFAGGELKHGSIALIEQYTPCILFVTKEHELEILANGAELKSRGATIIGVGDKHDELFDYYIRVNECDMSGPLLQIIPIQLLAYNLALLKKLDPDKPRNLAKSVTVK